MWFSDISHHGVYGFVIVGGGFHCMFPLYLYHVLFMAYGDTISNVSLVDETSTGRASNDDVNGEDFFFLVASGRMASLLIFFHLETGL